MNAQWTKNKRKDSLYLLLHGYGETPEVWHNVQKMIGDENCSAVNLIQLLRQEKGNGTFENLSTSIVQNIPQGKQDNITIVANSMGGYLAMELLKQQHERIQGLVLISTHPFVDDNAKIRQRRREAELIGKGKSKLLIQASTHAHAEPLKSTLEAMWNQWTDVALLNALNAMITRHPATGTIAESKIPIRFILGQEDFSIDYSRLKALTENNANVALYQIAGQDHWMLHHWQPDFVACLKLCMQQL